MSLVVNNNMMAANTARNLNAHYGRLATSTQRLSSGLRVNSAADDAAGLAIRELQRADIAALHQGARNANDAISMIQVADGSLGIIDEKLIRMKELAEQAATGTYDSTQRLMIESEYQAMASEITRIANATDFNGTKLLDGTLKGDHDGSGLISEGKMKIHFGTGNASAEDYYYVEIGECTSEAFGLGNNSTWEDVQRRGVEAFKESLQQQIKKSTKFTDEEKGKMLAALDDKALPWLEGALNDAISLENAFQYWKESDGLDWNEALGEMNDDTGFLKDGKIWNGNSSLMQEFLAAGAKAGEVDPAKLKQVYDQYVTTNYDAGSIRAKDPEGWKAAAAALTATAPTDGPSAKLTEDQILEVYLAKNEAKALQDAKGAGNATAWGAAGKTANQKILDAYLADPTKKAALATKIADDNKNGGGIAGYTDNGDPEADLATYLAGDTDGTRIALAITTAQGLGAPIDVATDDQIFEQYKTDNGGQVLADAKADATNWRDAGVEAAGGDDAVYRQYQIDQKQTIEIAKADTAGWEAARQAAAENTETAIFAEYQKAQGWSDKAGAMADANNWDAAIMNTSVPNQAATPAAPTEDEIVDQYLRDKGLPNNPTDVMIEDPAGWEKAMADAGVAKEDLEGATALADFWNGLRTTQQQKLKYAFGHAALYNLANADATLGLTTQYGIGAGEFNFGAMSGVSAANQDAANALFAKALDDMYAKVGHMDFAGHTIETQEDAQMALDAINQAIVSKDKIRAHLGAAQNRLENTVSNLNIQAENLQAAESRISDVDVATEMTQFVRNQILTQSAVAMLSQANSLPQMAMQLIGG